MSKPVIITADSVCDLSDALAKQWQIKTIPLSIIEGDASYKDGIEINPDRIYEIYRREGQLPKTAAVSPQEFLDFFRPLLAQGYEIVHLDISSKLSGTFQNACIAAAELEGVYPIDTTHLSNAMVLLLLEGCRLRDSGVSASEIAGALNNMRDRVHTSFVVDTLEFLWKGGRCSGVTALGANLLQIRPAIEMIDGELKVGRKYRGSAAKVRRQYLTDKLATENIDTSVAILTHSGEIAAEELEALRQLVLERVPFETLHLMRAGCTVSSHCGPGTVGFFYMTK